MRACEAWMSQIRAVAGQSPTGADFKARVEIGLAPGNGRVLRVTEGLVEIILTGSPCRRRLRSAPMQRCISAIWARRLLRREV